MEGTHVNYLGRVVPVEGFRAFIYGTDGTTKVVNSWGAYQDHIALGTWFGTREDAALNDLNPAPKPFKAKRKTGITLGIPANDAGQVSLQEILGTNDLVKDDDFLPTEGA